MPKTVIIAGFFPPPITGQGLATARLADMLEASVEVIRVNLREGEENVTKSGSGQFWGKMTRYIHSGRKFRDVIRSNRDATVIWTSISPEVGGHLRDYLTVFPALKAADRVFGVVHWGRFSQLFKTGALSITSRRLLNRLSGLVFLNNDRAEDCKQWVPDAKRFVIPNTLDSAVCCTPEEVEHKQGRSMGRKEVRLLFVGHMMREKGYLDVLEAARLAKEHNISFSLTFAGEWVAEEDALAFQKKLKAYSLEQGVQHLGAVRDRAQIKQLHLEADVFLLPSYMIEGQPLSIMEAMNAGSAIIAANQGGMVDMISHGKEGMLVPPQSPKAIAEAIMNLSNKDAWLQHSKAARDRYVKDYHPETVLALWQDLIATA